MNVAGGSRRRIVLRIARVTMRERCIASAQRNAPWSSSEVTSTPGDAGVGNASGSTGVAAFEVRGMSTMFTRG